MFDVLDAADAGVKCQVFTDVEGVDGIVLGAGTEVGTGLWTVFADGETFDSDIAASIRWEVAANHGDCCTLYLLMTC